jgi:hypothetical protein
MFVSHSPQEFISNCPTLCAHQILAMVLISLSAKSLPGHQANSPEGVGGTAGHSRSEDQEWRLWKHIQLRRQRNAVFARQIDIQEHGVWT